MKLSSTAIFFLSSSSFTMSAPLRVRKEFRSLTSAEKQRFADAVHTMKSTDAQTGQELFGNQFTNYDELVVLHACAVLDPRCDQGHFSPAFATFHRSVLLKFENSLLAIDPEIGAMPYWDVSLDSENAGIYYQHETMSIWSSENFGKQNGGGSENNYKVQDGLFADWPVSEFDITNFDHLDYQCLNDGWFTGYTATTCEACCGEENGSCLCGPNDEYKTFIRHHDHCNDHLTRDSELQTSNEVGGHYTIQYTAQDFEICTNPNYITNWMEWIACSNFADNNCLARNAPAELISSSSTDVADSDGNEQAKERTIEELEALEDDACLLEGIYYDADSIEKHVNSHHGGVHFRVGGDLEDVATSPNDPLFFLYHADVDRSLMTWQTNTKDTLESDLWHYPYDEDDHAGQTESDYASLNCAFSLTSWVNCGIDVDGIYTEFEAFQSPWWSGITLHEIVNEGAPFGPGLFSNDPANGFAYTHAEVITYTTPDSSPYSYDSLASKMEI